VWPVSRECVLLLRTWSYLCIYRGSVLPCTRFCICFFYLDYILHIIKFAIMYYFNWLINFKCIAYSPSRTQVLNGWLIDYLLFFYRSRIFHLYGDVTITGEGLQNLGLCSALRTFEQGGIFILPHLLWHGASVYAVSSEGPPHSFSSYNIQGDVEDLF
jgi:hypothetical protein